ncbi:MAG: excinuclease ABC subunit UvrA [Planctomycetes bacterium]|jgi:excinuclease ABC subunit A|nr:excinuclease ABC subunit UvrA [Planctomycetota bacterium]
MAEKNNLIKVRGARVNNLKNINVDIPRDQLIVITGLSGSGKSSLAFDTIYAEGQRRYVESLSSYARQFVDLMDKPDVDSIEGLSPAVSIDQKSVSNNPRSTVGTITEIYDFFRLLFAKMGAPYCVCCDTKMKKQKKENKGDGIIQPAFFSCPNCNNTLPELTLNNFSFNSSHGACPVCSGLGTKLEVDPELVLNLNLSLEQGAIKPLARNNFRSNDAFLKELEKVVEKSGFSVALPLKQASKKQLDLILYGDKNFIGLIAELERRYKETESNYVRQEIEQYMRILLCPTCEGKRLKKEMLAVKIGTYSINDIVSRDIVGVRELLIDIASNTKLSELEKKIFSQITNEVNLRLDFINNVGLNYLTLSRSATTLSGGEAQRIRLATQLGAGLMSVLYVLDEPSIGLHQRDNEKLIETLRALRDRGNTVIVVEHDEAMMLAADHLIDIGPGAGEKGGKLIFEGTPEAIKKCKESLTGQYLSGAKTIPLPTKYHAGNGKAIEILGASEHNLQNINVRIPLGKLVAITGVSGSGKSTLMSDILANSLNKKFYRAKVQVGKHKEIKGLEFIDKVIDIDQSPIGRTPRSNPATYTGAFTPIRDLFASLFDAKKRGYGAGHFSFNVVGGRCEQCSGDGLLKIEMQFLSDVYVTCDSCGGQRFKKEILEITYKSPFVREPKNIFEVLKMTVDEAMSFFQDKSAIYQKLETLHKVGLGYITLGQSATTLSGGEAQRVKLATELSRRATGKTLYILDEPTTGLHFEDINRLMEVLIKLVEKGNTVLIIEHNLDVIKAVDWIIDLGPDGGKNGGLIVAEGTPKEVAKKTGTYTGEYLNKILG